jgi:hypothetical protein
MRYSHVPRRRRRPASTTKYKIKFTVKKVIAYAL